MIAVDHQPFGRDLMVEKRVEHGAKPALHRGGSLVSAHHGALDDAVRRVFRCEGCLIQIVVGDLTPVEERLNVPSGRVARGADRLRGSGRDT